MNKISRDPVEPKRLKGQAMETRFAVIRGNEEQAIQAAQDKGLEVLQTEDVRRDTVVLQVSGKDVGTVLAEWFVESCRQDKYLAGTLIIYHSHYPNLKRDGRLDHQINFGAKQ